MMIDFKNSKIQIENSIRELETMQIEEAKNNDELKKKHQKL